MFSAGLLENKEKQWIGTKTFQRKDCSHVVSMFSQAYLYVKVIYILIFNLLRLLFCVS